jgi:hypothetical protein
MFSATDACRKHELPGKFFLQDEVLGKTSSSSEPESNVLCMPVVLSPSLRPTVVTTDD